MPWKDASVNGGKVRLKTSQVSSEGLQPSGLVTGEVALNAADGKLLYKKPNGVVSSIPSVSGMSDTIQFVDGNAQNIEITVVDGIITNWSVS